MNRSSSLECLQWRISVKTFLKAINSQVSVPERGMVDIVTTDHYTITYTKKSGLMILFERKNLLRVLEYVLRFHKENGISTLGKKGFRVHVSDSFFRCLNKTIKEGFTKYENHYVLNPTHKTFTPKPKKNGSENKIKDSMPKVYNYSDLQLIRLPQNVA